MKIDKANARDKKRYKRQHGMRVSGKSVLVIQSLLVKRAAKSS
jgi:hypothetical protein